MKYATTVYPKTNLLWSDVGAITANIGMLAIFYAFLGSLMSFVFYYLFDEYEPDDKQGLEWEKKSILYQVLDLCIEIVLISASSFWVVFTINERFPIFPIRTQFASYIDTYSTGLFFMYLVFVFVDSFGNKLNHIFKKHLSPLFDYLLPQEGSIVNLSLSYSKRKQNGSRAAF
jgi:hypothetical protein